MMPGELTVARTKCAKHQCKSRQNAVEGCSYCRTESESNADSGEIDFRSYKVCEASVYVELACCSTVAVLEVGGIVLQIDRIMSSKEQSARGISTRPL